MIYIKGAHELKLQQWNTLLSSPSKMDFPKLFQSAKAPDFTTAIAAILVVLWIFFLRRQRKASSRLPPGPTPWPIVGNLFQLGRLPHLKLAHFANKYGPIFSLRMGSVPTIVVSSSAMAKVILKTQDSNGYGKVLRLWTILEADGEVVHGGDIQC